MKNTVLKIGSLLLAVIMIMCCFAGCGNESTLEFDDDSMWDVAGDTTDNTESVDGSADNDGASGGNAFTENTPSKNQNSITKVDADNDEVAEKLNVNGKTCTILAPSEDELLINYFKKYCNGTLKYIKAECKLKLAQMSLAGNPPDIFRLNNQDYPSTVVQDLLLPLDTILDLDSYTWRDYKDEMSTYKYNGHYYVVPNRFTAESFIWWNTELFNQLGIKETPDTYMANGNWYWDALINTAKKIASAKDSRRAFAAHVNIGWWFDASAGETIVELTSKGLKNNLKNANIAKSRNKYAELFNIDKGINHGYDSSEEALAAGKLGMFATSASLGANDATKKLVANGTIKMAHFPKMPGSKEYTYAGFYSGYGIPKALQDKKVAVAFMTMLRVNEDYQNNASADFYNKMGMTSDMIKVYEEAKNCKFVPITGLGVNTCLQTISDIGVDHVQKGTPWATVVTKYHSKIQQGIDEFLTQGK